MDAGRKQLSKMVKPFIKLKGEPSSGLEPDSRRAGKGKQGSQARRAMALVAPGHWELAAALCGPSIICVNSDLLLCRSSCLHDFAQALSSASHSSTFLGAKLQLILQGSDFSCLPVATVQVSWLWNHRNLGELLWKKSAHDGSAA